MKNFLVGLSIGVPLGMLLADTFRADERSEMAERMREIWTDARRRAFELSSQAGERARRFAQDELRSIEGNAGLNLSELLDRQASEARQRASAASEVGMEQSGEAILNRVSRDELLAVNGIGPVLADRIAQGRPYTSDHDVVERGIVNETTFEQLRRQLLERYRKSA